jgi:hypothetical protein
MGTQPEDLIGDSQPLSPAVHDTNPSFPWDAPDGDHTPITLADKKREFCRLIAAGCTVRQASKAVGRGWNWAYQARDVDPEFAVMWEKASIHGIDQLVKEAYRRALSGSDAMLKYVLSNDMRERFSERSAVEVSGSLDLGERLLAARKRVGKE